jgi:hypothetical protein
MESATLAYMIVWGICALCVGAGAITVPIALVYSRVIFERHVARNHPRLFAELTKGGMWIGATLFLADRTSAMWRFRQDTKHPTADERLNRMRRISCWLWRIPVLSVLVGAVVLLLYAVGVVLVQHGASNR